MDTEALEGLGLTQTEIKTYLALLELGSAGAGEILDKSGLQNSVTHRALHTLLKKGVISFVLEGKRKVYQANKPESFLDYINEKKQQFEQLIPELKAKKGEKQQEARVFRGVRGVKEAYNEMINGEGEYNTFGGGEACVERMGIAWWENLHRRRAEKTLKARQVFDESVRKNDAIIAQLSKVKYLDKEFAQFQETVIVGNKVAINVFSDMPYSFVIEDERVAEGYRKYFEVLWKMAS